MVRNRSVMEINASKGESYRSKKAKWFDSLVSRPDTLKNRN